MKLLILLLIISNTAFSQTNEQILSYLNEARGILVQEITKNKINVPKFRPKGCPLISTRYEDIYKKFKGIEEGLNSACINTNKTAISTLNQSISNLDNMYSDYRVTSTPGLYDSKGSLIVVTKPEE